MPAPVPYGLQGLRRRQPPVNTASAPGRGLAYKPLSPLQNLAGGGLRGVGQLLMQLGVGRPDLAGQAFSAGLDQFDQAQRQNAADAMNAEAFDWERTKFDTEQSDRAEDKAAAAQQKADFDAAVDSLVTTGAIDAAEGDAIKAGVTKYEKPKPKDRKTTEIAGRLVDSETGELIKDYSAEEAALRQASRPVTNVTVGGESKADSKLREELSKSEGTRWSALQEAGTVSAGLGQDFEVLDELISVVPSGPLEGRLAEAFPGFSSAGDAFQSVVTRVAPSLRTPGSGATSDIEYEGMLKSLPRLRNQPEANRLIAGVMKSKAAINVERADVVTRYMNEEISATEARRQLAELNKRSIMTPELKKALGIVVEGAGDDDGWQEVPGRPGVKVKRID